MDLTGLKSNEQPSISLGANSREPGASGFFLQLRPAILTRFSAASLGLMLVLAPLGHTQTFSDDVVDHTCQVFYGL